MAMAMEFSEEYWLVARSTMLFNRRNARNTNDPLRDDTYSLALQKQKRNTCEGLQGVLFGLADRVGSFCGLYLYLC
jgi:hypothetical protein